MQNSSPKISAVVLSLLLVMIGLFAFHPVIVHGADDFAGSGGNFGDTEIDEFDSSGGGGIKNPLGSGKNTITDVLKGIINWMLGLVGILALIALITGGARMIIDFGNEDQVKKAKTTILWAVIGLLVVILSYAIINIVVSDILGGNSGASQSGPKPYDEDPVTMRAFLGAPAYAADPTTFQGGIDDVGKIAGDNKLSGKKTAKEILQSIVKWLLSLVGTVAVISLLYGGFLYITSQGEENKAAQAKTLILYSIIGIIVIGLSAIVVNVAIDLATST